MDYSDWAGPTGPIGSYVVEESERTLESYRVQPSLVAEHANQEQDAARGGYANRQIVELIQNSADQIAKRGNGEIRIRLTDDNLYCADDGAPLDEEGVRALLFSHLSPKRSTEEIGRFGIGFKAVLSVSDRPAVFSRAGSIQFDREDAAQRIRGVAPGAQACPVLRVANAVDVRAAGESDQEMANLMAWANNIVRLPLKPGAREHLASQFDDFRSEFLLFVKHVESLQFEYRDSAGAPRSRTVRLSDQDGILNLEDNDGHSRWALFDRVHPLSPAAREDTRTLDNAESVRIFWAAPLGGSGARDTQHFWASFPTQISSQLGGILNAPWKTNEDRQGLLPGRYNEELIDAAAGMVATVLPRLSDIDSPARHLDYLPRRQEAGDNDYAVRLRQRLNSLLMDAEVMPDQDGELRTASSISIPPREVTPGQSVNHDLLAPWNSYPHRPKDWLHEDALENERLSAIFRIRDGGLAPRGDQSRASVEEWLDALLDAGERAGDPVGASCAAVSVAAALSKTGQRISEAIIFTESGEWAAPVPDSVFLRIEGAGTPETNVHLGLMEDPEALRALKALGIREPSPDSSLRLYANQMLGQRVRDPDDVEGAWTKFWELARQVSPADVHEILSAYSDWRYWFKAKSVDGGWRPLCFLLWPGAIVPADGSRDASVAIDPGFHEADRDSLTLLGVVDELHVEEDWSYYWGDDSPLNDILMKLKEQYYQHPSVPSSNPRTGKFLLYPTGEMTVPIEAYPLLSGDGAAEFTSQLLSMAETFRKWLCHHDNMSGNYPVLSVSSPVTALIKSYGKVRLADDIHPIGDGLGESPKNHGIRDWLLSHPQADLIREHFDLPEHIRESFTPVGTADPLPLLDAWPGLRRHLSGEQRDLELIRCEALRSEFDGRPGGDAFREHGRLYIRRMEESEELSAVCQELGLGLTGHQREEILSYQTPEEIAEARAKVREQPTTVARLLTAVGEEELLQRLPRDLIDILSQGGRGLVGERAAEAAIAVYHTGVLKEYKHALSRLAPPRQWAGRWPALEFVRDLGFPDEWAGNPGVRREPFVDVSGPRSLPSLHRYQQIAVANIKQVLLRAERNDGENRGLLSLPTGSGKTRVAVQSIIETIRDDEFTGTVLWVADRGELCEQAVEAWSQAWMSIGPEAQPLRIARMWEGQRPELKRDGAQVIVGTIQTLRQRLDELEDIGLLVVDEAHGSIAPSFTQLMGHLGLSFRRHDREIPLLGLTATPYRGQNEEETRRLVERYGRNRLDSGAFGSDDPQDVIRELQRMRVLAHVEHTVVDGTTIELTEGERAASAEVPWLPESVEERIAADAERTRSIVDAYHSQVRGRDPDWPTLIFATSVNHAKTIAAMLELDNVSARAISAETDTPVRRSAIEAFRSGRLQVLVNYSVFREGFDAPKTRAIIVARPVYSPNLYFQMIGRGLRGEKNGGSDSCLIIDVADNIVNYDRQLAYTEMEGLWA